MATPYKTYSGSLATATAFNVIPGAGTSEQIVSITTCINNTDSGVTGGATLLYCFLYDGTYRGFLCESTYPNGAAGEQDGGKGGAIITDLNYLRLYNANAATIYYNVVTEIMP